MSEEKNTPEVVEETQAEAPAAAEEVKEEAAPAAEAPAADDSADAGEEVEVPAKFKAIVDAIEEMSVLDLNELVKLFEKKFGVSAAAVAVAGAGAGAGDAGEEKDSFDVELSSFGESKIPVMKVVKEALGLGLKEAKELVEAAPTVVKEGLKKEEAEELKGKIEEAGGKAELK
jgi:large subunit ribosomal protein L7/L12